MTYWVRSASRGSQPIIHCELCRSESQSCEDEVFPSLMEAVKPGLMDSWPGKPPGLRYRCHGCCESPQAVAQMRHLLGRLEWSNDDDEEPESGVCHCCSRQSQALYACSTEGANRLGIYKLALCGECKNSLPSRQSSVRRRGAKPFVSAGRYGSKR
jgi:hypothetical protein